MTRDPPMWTVSGTRRSEAYCVNFSIAVIASASGKCGRPLPTASKSIRWELGDWSSLVSAKIAALHKISNSHSHSFTGESSIFFPGPQIPIVVLPTYVKWLPGNPPPVWAACRFGYGRGLDAPPLLTAIKNSLSPPDPLLPFNLFSSLHSAPPDASVVPHLNTARISSPCRVRPPIIDSPPAASKSASRAYSPLPHRGHSPFWFVQGLPRISECAAITLFIFDHHAIFSFEGAPGLAPSCTAPNPSMTSWTSRAAQPAGSADQAHLPRHDQGPENMGVGVAKVAGSASAIYEGEPV